MVPRLFIKARQSVRIVASLSRSGDGGERGEGSVLVGFARSFSRRRRIDARKRVIFCWRHGFLYSAPPHRAKEGQKENGAALSRRLWRRRLLVGPLAFGLHSTEMPRNGEFFCLLYCHAHIATTWFTKSLLFCAMRIEASRYLV